MTESAKDIIKQALKLSPTERALVAEQLLLSLDHPDSEIDAIWAFEAEARIDAYERGEIEGVSVNEVFGKYEKR